MYKVYIIKNNINDKKYIGCTHNIQQRIKQHMRYLKGGYHHNRNLQLDYDNFDDIELTFDILFESADEEEAYIKEEELISKYDSINKGYNLALGGKYNKGYIQSEYAKKVASEVHSKKVGHLNSFYGKKHSEESKRKMSEKLTGRKGHSHSEEYKLNSARNSPHNKAIYYYGREYISITQASNLTGNTRKTIRLRLNDDNNKEAYFL